MTLPKPFVPPQQDRTERGGHRKAAGGLKTLPYDGISRSRTAPTGVMASFPVKKLKFSCFFRKSPFTFGDTYGIIKRLAMCRTIFLCPLLSCGRKLYEQYTTRPYLAFG